MTKYDPKIERTYYVRGKPRLEISGICPVTLKPWKVTNVDKNGWEQYQNGADINAVLSGLDHESRTLLVDGILPEGWEILLNKEKSGDLP